MGHWALQQGIHSVCACREQKYSLFAHRPTVRPAQKTWRVVTVGGAIGIMGKEFGIASTE